MGDGIKFAFDTVYTNVGAGWQGPNDFICPVSGFYMFAFSMTTQHKTGVHGRVTVDGGEGPQIYGDSMGTGFGSASHTGMAHCSTGQRVFVLATGGSQARGSHFCSFSGALIRADD